MILEYSRQEYISVEEDLNALELYIQLEQERGNNAFTYEISVDHNLYENEYLIPSMLFQPFVENAILHGLRHKKNDVGELFINLKMGNNQLICNIIDNGIGRAAAERINFFRKHQSKSVGVELTRERIQKLDEIYPGRAYFKITDIETGNDSGTIVEIGLPPTHPGKLKIMIKAILIDDESASIEALKIKILKASDEIEVIRTFNSAIDALEKIEKLAPDVVFLDVEMPEMDGFGFLENFPERTFEVIISTAHDEYAIQAVRQSALDFLLKPVSVSELSKAIDRLIQKLNAKNKAGKGASKKVDAQFDKIPIPSLRGITFVPVKDILYMMSEGNYTIIYLETKQKIVSSRNLGDYETMVDNLNFFRIHHSTLINLAHIREYMRGEGGSVILSDGTELDVSKRRKKEFMEVIGF